MRCTAENQIKTIAKKINHTHLEERNLDYLFSLLATDVYYMGSGRNMHAEGQKKVEYFLTNAITHLYPLTIIQEKFFTKRMGRDYWLCEVISNAEIKKPETETSRECLHTTFVFRHRKDVKPGAGRHEWEVVHVHACIASSLLPAEAMLHILQANQKRKKLNIYEGLTEREVKLVRMLRKKTPIRDIAQDFGLAEITIKKALAKIYQKYGQKNRARLCVYLDALERDSYEEKDKPADS